MSVKDLPRVLRPHGLDAVDFVLLEAFSADDWYLFFNFLEKHGFSAGDVLLRQGDDDRSMFILTLGTLTVQVTTDGGSYTVDSMDPGTVFGEQSFVDGHARTATIVADSAGEYYRLSLEAFERFSAAHPALALTVITDVARVLSLRCRMLQGIRSRVLAGQD